MQHCSNKTEVCIFLTYKESQGQWLRWECGLYHITGDPGIVWLTLFSRCSPSPPSILYIQCCCSLLIWKSSFQIWLYTSHSFVVIVQSLSCVWLFVTPWTAARQASLSFTISWSCSCPLSRWCHPIVLSSAAAAKSIQLCPTLCDPRDGSLPGFPIPGILQARTLEWVAISFSNVWKWKVKVKLLSRSRLLATPWTAAYQAPLPMDFSRQEYWSGVPLPSLVLSSRELKKKKKILVLMLHPKLI